MQSDIAQQLGLVRPLRSIEGFRRKNIGIEVVEVPPAARRDAVIEILENSIHRPAIVYVPTRSECDALAADLAGLFRSEPYHAGLLANRRQQVQEGFLSGSLDVIVATIAFGMGIDKPDVRTVIHTALPGSTEAYYQEIGRAGRDGAPSRAILMHSYADRHRHDFFFNRDYPERDVLDRIFDLLRTDRAVAKQDLQKLSKLDPDLFDTALEKLWVHGGVTIDPEENVTRGAGKWREAYLSQSEQRSVQVELMLRYAASDQCRMAALVRHFGDRADTQAWCGLCDFCAPEQCVAQRFRKATAEEAKIARQIVEALAGGMGRSSGRLHGELCAKSKLDRNEFEEVLGSMARAGLITLREAVFEKDGKQIPYRTAQLTQEGENIEPDEPLLLEIVRLKKRAAAPSLSGSNRKINSKPGGQWRQLRTTTCCSKISGSGVWPKPKVRICRRLELLATTCCAMWWKIGL